MSHSIWVFKAEVRRGRRESGGEWEEDQLSNQFPSKTPCGGCDFKVLILPFLRDLP